MWTSDSTGLGAVYPLQKLRNHGPRVDLYVKYDCVKRGIPSENAVEAERAVFRTRSLCLRRRHGLQLTGNETGWNQLISLFWAKLPEASLRVAAVSCLCFLHGLQLYDVLAMSFLFQLMMSIFVSSSHRHWWTSSKSHRLSEMVRSLVRYVGTSMSGRSTCAGMIAGLSQRMQKMWRPRSPKLRPVGRKRPRNAHHWLTGNGCSLARWTDHLCGRCWEFLSYFATHSTPINSLIHLNCWKELTRACAPRMLRGED